MTRPHTHGGDHAHAASHAGIDTPEHLAEHLAEVVGPGTVVVCVGNELCGDDAAGVHVARRLTGAVPWRVFDTQSVPESFLMKIAALKPDCVVLVDALHFGADPGGVELFAAGDVGGQGPSTHGPAPLAFLEVLAMIHPCRRVVLGIQPKQVAFGDAMSAPVARAVELVERAFRILADRPDEEGHA